MQLGLRKFFCQNLLIRTNTNSLFFWETRLPIHTVTTTIHLNQIKINLSLYLLYYDEARNQLTEPISASVRPGKTAPFEKCRSGGKPLATLYPI